MILLVHPCPPTRCEYERWRSLADEEALPPGERCRAARPPAAVAPLHLQQRDDRVCDKGASTSGGDHVFFRLFVRPYCRSGRETRLLGMERLWGRASPAAAMCACGKVHHAGSPHHQPAVRTFVRQHGHESRAGGSATGGGRRQQVSLCAWGELCVRRQGTALLCMW